MYIRKTITKSFLIALLTISTFNITVISALSSTTESSTQKVNIDSIFNNFAHQSTKFDHIITFGSLLGAIKGYRSGNMDATAAWTATCLINLIGQLGDIYCLKRLSRFTGAAALVAYRTGLTNNFFEWAASKTDNKSLKSLFNRLKTCPESVGVTAGILAKGLHRAHKAYSA